MRKLLFMVPVVLSSCATHVGPAVPITSAPPGSNCVQTTALDSYVGQPATAELGARLLAASGARVLRWVPHGGVVTMDYRAHRLTAWLDASNRIERVNCG